MLRKLEAACVIAVLALVLGGCVPRRQAVSLTVAAGAGLSEVMPAVGADFERAQPDIKVTFTFGNAGAISAQVKQGAPVDVVLFPSGGGHMDALERDGFILPGSRRVVARDDLVLAVPAGKQVPADPWSWLRSSEVRRVAIGDPKAVPAGVYAMQVLRHLGLDAALEPKLVYAGTVRQALVYVEQGEAEAALVYRSTVRGSDRARVAAVAPPETHDAIFFEGAVVKAARHADEAQLFLQCLLSPGAARVFEEHGFRAAK